MSQHSTNPSVTGTQYIIKYCGNGYSNHNFLFCFAFKAYFNNEAISPQSLLDNIRTIADQNFAVRHDRQSEVKTLSDFSDCSERFTYYRKIYSLSFYY